MHTKNFTERDAQQQTIEEAPTLDITKALDPQQLELIQQWNQTNSDYPQSLSIAQLFEQQTKATPTHPALALGTTILTYQTLNQHANVLAHTLRQAGVGPEVLVGICFERSLELIVCLLAILKAGGAYLPLDPGYPEERLHFMLQDAEVSLLVTQSHLKKRFTGSLLPLIIPDDGQDVPLTADENLTCTVSPDNLAYVMYTSGSTGAPKGVSVTQRNIIRLVKNTDYVHFTADETFLQLASVSFDAATFEIWGALLNGAKLVLCPEQAPSPAELGQIITQTGVTTLWLTAGLFHQMVDAERELQSLQHVHQLLAGGDVLSQTHVQNVLRKLPACQLINGYGPTEGTTFSCCYSIPSDQDCNSSIPIGYPIANTRLYILDGFLELVPIGQVGELYIGGSGVARGYFKRPDLTAEKFLPDPFSTLTGERLYKTGDRARYQPDGKIEFLGRIDRQVKIRGFRIEPDEIERSLVKHPEVQEALITTQKDASGNTFLASYLLTKPQTQPSTKELRAFLMKSLPDYMIPAVFLHVTSWPLTSNGKIDRAALPAPVLGRSGIDEALIQPQTPTEEIIATIWMNVLGLAEVGIHDNFFELGGNSLFATQVTVRIRDWFQFDTTSRSLFLHPTIALFAQKLEHLGREKQVNISRIAQILLLVQHLSDDEVQNLLQEKSTQQDAL
jgi:amino acid adenylation domain-containing protein